MNQDCEIKDSRLELNRLFKKKKTFYRINYPTDTYKINFSRKFK